MPRIFGIILPINRINCGQNGSTPPNNKRCSYEPKKGLPFNLLLELNINQHINDGLFQPIGTPIIVSTKNAQIK
jgi:hypothetical protein